MALTIYGLTHVASGKSYVGSTTGKPSKRLREHRCLLRNGKHTSVKIQSDWYLYGEGAFRFEIFEELEGVVTFEQRKSAEQRWIDIKKSDGLLYNAYEVAFGFLPEAHKMGIEASKLVPGRRWTPEANLKRRMAQLGKPNGHGAKISATKRARKMMQVDEIV